ncbi:MAG: serine hydrolase [Ginsengibacter sp.]
MKKNISLHSLLFIFLSGFTFFVHGQGFTPQVQAHLQKILDSFQNNPNNPFVGGISAAINVDALAEWNGAAGYAARNVDAQNNLLAGGTPFTIPTLSRIYSVTKTFTAPLVIELAGSGAFSLDDPITKYLAALPVVNPGLNTSVTIRQLLAHESGFSDYTDEFQLQVAVAFAPTHIWTPYEMVSFVHQINTPGAERRYSSTNYILLGAIVESATGKPIEQHFRERFFDPLHFSSMYLGGREAHGNREALAAPHDNISAFNPVFQFTGQPTFPDAYTNIYRFPMDAIVSLAFTSGGIVSNAEELAKWGNALFGGRATSKETIDLMMKSIPSTTDRDGDHLGYGIFKSTRMSETIDFIGHDGVAPGYRSVMFYQPDRKMTIVVLTNYHGANAYLIAKALYAALPEFLCGNENKKEEKIQVCFKGQNICVDRSAAPALIDKGATLGKCVENLVAARTSVMMQGKLPEQILTASPNPFSNSIDLSFRVSDTGPANLSVYDVSGKRVANLFDGVRQKGTIQQVKFSAGTLPAGIYLSRLKTATGITEQKIVLQR